MWRSSVGRLIQKFPDEVTCSVYLDDLAISSPNLAALEDTFAELVAALNASNFPINDAKTVGPTSALTLFNCDVAQGSTRVTQTRKDEFYAALHTAPSIAGFETYCEKVEIGNT
jgi:hypothetical protein